MRRVFAWATTNDACLEYRIRIPFTALNAGPDRWSCSWGAPGPDIADYDVVVGQRLAGDQPDWLKLCADPDVLAVYDMDDDLLNIDPQNTVPYAIYAPVAEQTRELVAAADLVTVCTPHVAEVMAKVNPNVVLLPICADPAWLDLPLLTCAGRLTVGWAGSPFHAQDWAGLPEVLAQYARLEPRATWHSLGADYTAGAFGARARTTGMQPHGSHLAAIDLDIGLAPLARSPHNRGKSWTRPLEYAVRGVPVLAQAWGQYPDWVDDGVNGLLVHDDTQWLDHLLALSDDTVRAPMSTAARDTARRWTIDRHIGLWEAAYSGSLP